MGAQWKFTARAGRHSRLSRRILFHTLTLAGSLHLFASLLGCALFAYARAHSPASGRYGRNHVIAMRGCCIGSLL